MWDVVTPTGFWSIRNWTTFSVNGQDIANMSICTKAGRQGKDTVNKDQVWWDLTERVQTENQNIAVHNMRKTMKQNKPSHIDKRPWRLQDVREQTTFMEETETPERQVSLILFWLSIREIIGFLFCCKELKVICEEKEPVYQAASCLCWK